LPTLRAEESCMAPFPAKLIHAQACSTLAAFALGATLASGCHCLHPKPDKASCCPPTDSSLADGAGGRTHGHAAGGAVADDAGNAFVVTAPVARFHPLPVRPVFAPKNVALVGLPPAMGMPNASPIDTSFGPQLLPPLQPELLPTDSGQGNGVRPIEVEPVAPPPKDPPPAQTESAPATDPPIWLDLPPSYSTKSSSRAVSGASLRLID